MKYLCAYLRRAYTKVVYHIQVLLKLTRSLGDVFVCQAKVP